MEKNLFELATREKFRWVTARGELTVEQLWDLPLQTNVENKPSLENVAQSVYAKIKEFNDVSFVNPKTVSDEKENAKLEILKHIIAVRQREKTVAFNEAVARAQRERARDILAKRADDALEKLSDEELKALVEQK